MKIGFFTDSYLPTATGLETSIESFRKILESLGHHVYVFAPRYKGYKEKNPRVFRFRSLKIIKKPEIYLASPFSSVDSFKKIKDLKLDIIHAQTPFSLGIFAKYLASYQKKPILYTYHTQYPDYAKFYLKEKILLPYLAQALVAWFSNMCDAAIAPSYKIKRYLENYGVKKTIYILPTGINIDIFKKSFPPAKISELRKKLKISGKTKLLIFVGRMGHEKNLEFLLDMFKEVIKQAKIPINLLMVGDGPYLKYFRQKAKKLKIDSFVKFTGSVPHTEIPLYYQTADIFVFSSLMDTQGIVMLEAMASGLPVVALEDDAFKKIVINNKNGFLIDYPIQKNLSKKIKEKDCQKIKKTFAKKILTLLSDVSLYKKFSKNSRQTADQYSEEKQTKKLLLIYKNLIRKKN